MEKLGGREGDPRGPAMGWKGGLGGVCVWKSMRIKLVAFAQLVLLDGSGIGRGCVSRLFD